MPFSNKPLYLQVRDALAHLISAGTWKPGFQVPAESELAREVGVSSGTVRKALELMESQGLIVRRQGRGSFVANPALEELADRYVKLHGPAGERLRSRQTKVVKFEQCASSSVECSRLRLLTGAQVYRWRRVQEHIGASFLLEDVVLPTELFSGRLDGSDAAQEIGILAQRHGILLGKAEERITVGLPPQDVAELLHHPRDKAVMRLDRVVMMLDGRSVEWRIAYWHMASSHYVAEIK